MSSVVAGYARGPGCLGARCDTFGEEVKLTKILCPVERLSRARCRRAKGMTCVIRIWSLCHESPLEARVQYALWRAGNSSGAIHFWE